MIGKEAQVGRGRARIGGLAAVVGLCAPFIMTAVPTYAADHQKAFPQGAFRGQIIDAASGKPVADATVALRDRRGKVVSWTKTDPQGHYTLAADSLGLLDLGTPHRRGMLAALGRGVVQVVEVPVKAVGVAAGAATGVAVNAVKAVDPIGTVKAAAVAAAEGSPVPLAGKAAADVAGLTGIQTEARKSAAEAAVNGKPAPPKKAPTGPGPGEVALLVSAPQYKQFQGVAGSYWMQPPGREQGGPQAWLDTVRLAPNSVKQDSDMLDQAAHLTDPSLDPALAAAGSPVKLTVKLQTPAAPDGKVRVVARERKTGHVAELTPQGGGVYAGTLTLDPKTPTGDTMITVAALNATPVGVDLPSAKGEDPLLTYASRLDDLDAGKPYRFDPRIMASENRLDLKMMILDPSRETPPPGATTPPPAPAPASSTPAPVAPPKP